MAVRHQSERDAPPDQHSSPPTRIAAYESRPGRLVFLEDGNTDGWIATDDFVDLAR